MIAIVHGTAGFSWKIIISSFFLDVMPIQTFRCKSAFCSVLATAALGVFVCLVHYSGKRAQEWQFVFFHSRMGKNSICLHFGRVVKSNNFVPLTDESESKQDSWQSSLLSIIGFKAIHTPGTAWLFLRDKWFGGKAADHPTPWPHQANENVMRPKQHYQHHGSIAAWSLSRDFRLTYQCVDTENSMHHNGRQSCSLKEAICFRASHFSGK
jgi:hypothetical protein